jgi:hypothetical protein
MMENHYHILILQSYPVLYLTLDKKGTNLSASEACFAGEKL